MSRLTENIAEFAAQLPAPGRLSEQRAAAADAFSASGLPAKTDERWRYTDLSALAQAQLQLATAGASRAPDLDLLALDGDRIVFVDGQLDASRTHVDAASGISALAGDWSALAEGFPRFSEVIAHPLGQLNTAASQHGVHVRTREGSAASEPLHIVLAHSSEAPAVLQPRIVIELAPHSTANIVLQYIGDSQSTAWSNAVIEILQHEGSRLDYLQLQEQSTAQTHTALISAALDRDASATIATFDLGAKLARTDIDVALNGRGSSVSVFGAFLPIDAQHIDTHVCIDHAAADSNSTTWFRGMAGERCRGVFNSKVIVRPDSQRISAEQRSDNLLLAEHAEIDTKPELEIYADDVRCSHGATVGELDEQHLFYLQSRGIDERAARALLTFAFARTAVEHIDDETLRELIAARIARRLPEHERWERLN